MDIDISDLFTSGSTGYHGPTISRIIKYPFEKYIVDVALDHEGKFLGVVSIEISQKYIDYNKIKIDKTILNVDKYYED